MVAGDPESDTSASECVNFLDLFDIGAGAPGFLTPCFFCGAERQLLFQKNKGNALVTKPGCDSAHIRHIPAKAIDGMNQKRITRS